MWKKYMAAALAALMVCGAVGLPIGAGAPAQATVTVRGSHAPKKAASVFKLVNRERAAYGCAALKWDSALERAARRRAQEISVRFSHTRPNGSDCFSTLSTAERVGFTSAGENIAAGDTQAAGVMDGWMHSPGHRANILRPEFTHIGVACVQVGGVYYWVQMFGGGSRKKSVREGKSGSFSAKITGVKKDFKLAICLPETYPFEPTVKVKKVRVGKKQKVRLTVRGKENFRPAHAALSAFKWKSSNPRVLSVGKTGTLKAKRVGKVTITATAKNGTIRIRQKIKAVA